MKIAARFVLVACCLAAAPAAAQSPEAESLFREGKALLAKGKVAEACAKLEASDKIDPKAGTELNLADCRERNKQTATAWALFLKASATAKKENDPRRAAEAKRRAKLLEPKLRYLTIQVADDRRVDGLVITRDGQPVDAALWNQRVPIDPGTYDIAGRAPNFETWKEQVEIDQNDEIAQLPVLGKITGTVEPIVKAPEPTTRTTPRRYRGATIAASAATLIGAGVAVGFGLRARSQSNDADAKCPNANCLDEGALDLNKRARTSAVIANAGIIVGGVGLIAATMLWWKGRPRTEKVAVLPAVGRDVVGIALEGRF